jgi:hypothetical protein
MFRSKSLTIAAGLKVILGILIAMSATRILSAGSAGLPPPPGAPAGQGGPPFLAGLLFMTMAIACLFAAYGLWKNQKWGKIVAIITSALNGLFSLGDVLGLVMQQNYALAVGFALVVLMEVFIIVLVLRREPRPQLA